MAAGAQAVTVITTDRGFQTAFRGRRIPAMKRAAAAFRESV